MNQPLIPKVSVIVPVYKVEAYLQECIDSILAQTFTDFELILVNDGSPDNCGAICDQNASRDSRIRVIHQENQGVTRARANGVAAAKGEFINFVDSDDTIPPHSLATLAAHADGATDIVLGKREKNRGYGQYPPPGEISHDKYREYTITASMLGGGPVARLYRKSLFGDDVFLIPPEVRNGEDHIMNILIAYKVQGRIYNIDTVVYDYRCNPDSTSHLCATPECIAAYQTYRLAAIPPQDIEKFLPLGLADHLFHLWINATNHRIRIPKSTLAAQRQLLSFKKYSSIKFPTHLAILLYCNNPIIRAIIITIRRLTNYLRKKLNFSQASEKD